VFTIPADASLMTHLPVLGTSYRDPFTPSAPQLDSSLVALAGPGGPAGTPTSGAGSGPAPTPAPTAPPTFSLSATVALDYKVGQWGEGGALTVGQAAALQNAVATAVTTAAVPAAQIHVQVLTAAAAAAAEAPSSSPSGAATGGGGGGGGGGGSVCTGCTGYNTCTAAGGDCRCKSPTHGVCYGYRDALTQACWGGTAECAPARRTAEAVEGGGGEAGGGAEEEGQGKGQGEGAGGGGNVADARRVAEAAGVQLRVRVAGLASRAVASAVGTEIGGAAFAQRFVAALGAQACSA
jgi:hypothetical protein